MGTGHAEVTLDVRLRRAAQQFTQDRVNSGKPSQVPADEEDGAFVPDTPAVHRPQPREVAGAPVTVLTTDIELCAALRAAVVDDHPVFIASRLEDAVKVAASGRCPILITDQALDAAEFARVTTQLRAHEPALVIVAVGNRGQDHALKDLMSARRIDRFMLKPVTPALTRLIIESVAREYRWRTAHTHTDSWSADSRIKDSAPVSDSRTIVEQPQATQLQRASVQVVPELLPLQSAETTTRKDDIVLNSNVSARWSWLVVAAVMAALAAVALWITLLRSADIDPPQEMAKSIPTAPQPFDAGLNLFIEDAATLIAAGQFTEAVAALESLRRVQPEHPRLPLLEAQLREALQARILQAHESPVAPDPQQRSEAVALPEIAGTHIEQPLSPNTVIAQHKVSESGRQVLLETTEPITLAPITPGQLDTANEPIAQEDQLGIDAPAARTAANTQIAIRGNDLDPAAIAAAPPTESKIVQLPQVIKLVQPEYPSEARLRGIEGWVDLSLAVTASGDVADLRVESSSMNHLFGRAARTAVKQWKYQPRATADPSERLKVRVQFRLND